MRNSRSHFDRDRRGYGVSPNRRRESMSGRGGGGRGETGRFEEEDNWHSQRHDDYGYDGGTSGRYEEERRSGGRGFAAMEDERHREISARGGRHSGGGWDNRYEEEEDAYENDRYDNEGYSGRLREEEDERSYAFGGRSRAGSQRMNRDGRGRGFAGMDRERVREIASRGGRAAHRSGAAHEWDSREAFRAGRLGGRSRRY